MANQNQGPFSAQLQQPFQAPANPAAEAGYGGLGSGIMHFATSFLEGASRSRLAKMAEAETQRNRNINALTSLLGQADQMGLAPEGKAAVQQRIMGLLLPQIAGADNGGKGKEQGGNPLFGFVKGLAQNLLPQGQTKAQPIDEATLGGMLHFMGEQPTVRSMHSTALERVHAALANPANRIAMGTDPNSPTMVDAERLAGDKDYQEAMALVQKSGTRSPEVESALSRLVPGLATSLDVKNDVFHAGVAERAFGGGQRTPAVPAPSPIQNFMSAQPEGAGEKIQSFLSAVSPVASNSHPVPDVTPQADAAYPFYTGQTIPGETLKSIVINAKNQGYTPRKVWAVDPNNRNQHVGITVYGPNMAVADDGNVVDLQKVNASGWAVAQTPPAVTDLASPEEVQRNKGLFSQMMAGEDNKQNADLVAKFAPMLEAASSMSKPLEAMQGVMTKFNSMVEARRQDANSQKDRMALRNFAAANKPGGGGFSGPEHALITKYRQEVQKLPEFKNASEIRQKLAVAEGAYGMAAKGDLNAQGVVDHALISAAALAMDTKTGVRDAERVMWAETMGKLQKLGIVVNGGLTQGRLLNDETRRDIMNLLRISTSQAEDSLRSAAEPTLEQARSMFGERYSSAESMIVGRGGQAAQGGGGNGNRPPLNPRALGGGAPSPRGNDPFGRK